LGKSRLTVTKRVKGWLETYGEKSTRKVLVAGLKHYLCYVYDKSFEVENSTIDYEQLASQYIGKCRKRRNWLNDVLTFATSLHTRPRVSASVYMIGVKSFLEFSLDIELTKKQTRTLRSRLPKGRRARTQENDLTSDVLRQILSHSDLKGRALSLLLESSGIRIGDALKVQLVDIDLNSDPVKVTIRDEYTKEGDTYYTFINQEVKEALLEWLKVRESYLGSQLTKGRG